MKFEAYQYEALSIPGGGFVTGFCFHPHTPHVCYARTDIGGVYRFLFEEKRWIPLFDWVDAARNGLMQVSALALDPDRPGRLFALCGNESYRHRRAGQSAFLVSEDFGETFLVKPVPFRVNGNGPARSCGSRLCFAGGTLYYASQEQGLFCSQDLGEHWEPIPTPHPNLNFVYVPPTQNYIILSSIGDPVLHPAPPLTEDVLRAAPRKPEPIPEAREHSLFIGTQNGHFTPLPMPEISQNILPKGLVGVSYQAQNPSEKHPDELHFYVAFSGAGSANAFAPYHSFACDSGGSTAGRLWCYHFDGHGSLLHTEDITPDIGTDAGLGGVAVHKNMIYCATIGQYGNSVYRSLDGGKHFSKVLSPKDTEKMDVDVPYLKPYYNNRHIPLHWMSCLALSPHDPNLLLINTGTGVFGSTCAAAPEETLRFTTLCNGMEETVHLNIYAPPEGAVQALDIVGDLGGFAFQDVTRPCKNSFANFDGHRYITCNNADFTDTSVIIPRITGDDGMLPRTRGVLYVVTARGNWVGNTTGGLICSGDDCKHFAHLPLPYGVSPYIDTLCDQIAKPNVNSGWCALSSNGKSILWTLADRWFHLPVSGAVYTTDFGKSYVPIQVFDLQSRDISQNTQREIKLFSDRVHLDWFYGFGEAGQVYVSTDCGKTFYQQPMPAEFCPDFYFSGIDGMKRGEIRCESGKAGSIWVAAEKHGLWHLSFDGITLRVEKMSAPDDTILRIGLGKGPVPGIPALYCCGIINGSYGLYRQDTREADWVRINTPAQCYGGITGITGDYRREKRVYLATNARGALWGDPT